MMKSLTVVLAILGAAIIHTTAHAQAYPDPSIGTGSAHYIGPDLGGTNTATDWRVGLSFILFGAPAQVAATDAPWIARLVSRSVPAKEHPVRTSARGGARPTASAGR